MSELLKAAIADAKAVRATALANARAALEEAFTPRLESMLSAKLQQEISDDEQDLDAALAPAPEAPVDAPLDMTPAPEAPVDAAAPVELPPEGGADLGAPAPVEPAVDDEESLEEYQPLGAGNPDSVDQNMCEEKSNSLKGAPTGHKTEDPQGASVTKTFKKAATSLTKGEPKEKTAGKTTVDREVSSAQKDPQGASKEVSKGLKKTDSGTSPLKEVEDVEDIDDQSLDEILKELEAEVQQATSSELSDPQMDTNPAPVAPAAPVAACEVAQGDEEINLDELLESDDKDEDDEKEEKSEKKDDEKDEDRGNKEPWMKENISLKAELQEYRNTVQYLRDRINEVNLLNAKLLYTNKLFKSTSMTNERKLSVIEAFDLTKSVREAKLIYATLSESLNFGVKPVKPSTKATTVKSITEGLASKVVASTKPTKAVITEGAEMANRFKKLAGIKN